MLEIGVQHFIVHPTIALWIQLIAHVRHDASQHVHTRTALLTMAVLTRVPKVVCVTQDMSWIPLVQNSSVFRLKIVDARMGMAILMEV